jgi:L-methionine (R)-S-oxide reductase
MGVFFFIGFYIASQYMPSKPISDEKLESRQKQDEVLLLGPFSGKPACQFIRIPHEPKDATRSLTGAGVCSDAYYFKKTLRVPNVEEYPGHIACDGETKSEIVIPIFVDADRLECVGVLDLDCLAENGFEEEDQKGLEAIAALVGKSCGWVKMN